MNTTARTIVVLRGIVAAAITATHILRLGRGARRWSLFAAYVRMKAKHLIVFKVTRRKPTHDTLLGFVIHFFDYGTFVALFEEVFIHREYAFSARGKTPLILDCGSNIGMSVLFFKFYYPRARIIAFEPDPETFALLERNVRENRLADVTLVRAALGAREGMTPFYTHPQMRGALTMSTEATRVPGGIRMNVPMVTLSAYVHEHTDFLKLDVEGAETVVLAELSMHGVLQRIHELALEYHHHIRPGHDALSEALALLEQSGFTYQLSASIPRASRPDAFQDILVRAYNRDCGFGENEP